MNLLDVIPALPKAKSKVSAAVLADYEKSHGRYATSLDVLMEALKKAPTDDVRQAVVIAANAIERASNSSMEAVVSSWFKEHHRLPDLEPFKKLKFASNYDLGVHSTQAEFPVMSKFSLTPKMSMTEARALSATLNMVIMPFDYLDKRSFASDHTQYRTRSSINGFVNAAKTLEMTPYVIAPLSQYSIQEHLKANNPDLPIVGNAYEQYFEVIGMMMPGLLMVSDRLTAVEAGIRSLYGKLDSLDSQMRGVVRGLESLEKRMTSLEDKVNHVQREQLAAKLRQEEIARMQTDASAFRSSWFRADDPLLLALPAGTTLDTATTVFVGPCWGPDFPNHLAEALGLVVKNGQRAKFESLVLQF